jgi:CHAD domain-containing protein
MPFSTTHPVQSLREHITALEAALAVCLAEPRPKAIHRLRSESRRIEAQLLLLRALPGIPSHTGQAAKLQRELRKLRHAAGRVRDLDIHRQLLGPRSRLTSRSEPAVEQREGALALCDELVEQRQHAAEKLQELIRKHAPQLAEHLESLSKALKPSLNIAVTATPILEFAEAYFARATGRRRKSAKRKDVRESIADTKLHELRKAAKMVRYLAESAPRTQHAVALAKRFEAVQDSGGHWHDWLQLSHEARATLGRKHLLTRALAETRNHHRAGFLHSLNGVL